MQSPNFKQIKDLWFNHKVHTEMMSAGLRAISWGGLWMQMFGGQDIKIMRFVDKIFKLWDICDGPILKRISNRWALFRLTNKNNQQAILFELWSNILCKYKFSYLYKEAPVVHRYLKLWDITGEFEWTITSYCW